MKKGYLSFSLDYDGRCQDVDTYEVDDVNLTENVNYESVDKYVQKLWDEVEGFNVSEHRTEVQVWWRTNVMEIHYRYFNEPEDGEFDDIELYSDKPIEFVN